MPHSQEQELTWHIDNKDLKTLFSFNRQRLEQQIITTRRSIKNRKLILSQNVREKKSSIEEYNSRKLILQALKTLKTIPLRNDTIYRNQITKGTIHNTEIYRLIHKDVKNFANSVKQHPVIARNQSYRLREFEILQKAHKL